MNLVQNFFLELQSSLATSTGTQRKSWAKSIVDENIPVTTLVPVLSSGGKTASNFLWLVSDVAIQNPQRFLKELPELLEHFEENYPEHLSSFASWWHYCGVPVENEARAIDYLFKWFLSAQTKPYIKTRALWVLVELCKKYPELKQELKLCLEDHPDNYREDKYSKEFRKRAEKILLLMNSETFMLR